jgi:hypothetical protein
MCLRDHKFTARARSWFFQELVRLRLHIWLVVWNMIFSICWECHHPNWRSPSFFRGVGINTTNQMVIKGYIWLLIMVFWLFMVVFMASWLNWVWVKTLVPSEPQITGKWMFIPPNIARLVLIHPQLADSHFLFSRSKKMFLLCRWSLRQEDVIQQRQDSAQDGAKFWSPIVHHFYGDWNHQNRGGLYQWIGLRENLQETMVFTIKYGGFL